MRIKSAESLGFCDVFIKELNKTVPLYGVIHEVQRCPKCETRSVKKFFCMPENVYQELLRVGEDCVTCTVNGKTGEFYVGFMSLIQRDKQD